MRFCPRWLQAMLRTTDDIATHNSLSLLLTALKQCGQRGDLQTGKELHSVALKTGLYTSTYVANALVNMYRKCRNMHHAQHLFDSMDQPDVVSWNVLILGYVEYGENLTAIDLFASLECEPSVVTFVGAVKACASLAGEKQTDYLEKGMAIHRKCRENGFDTNIFLATNLVDMYSKCRSMWDARAVFDNMPEWDVVLWNALILGYVEDGQNLLAMDMFRSIHCQPSVVTFVAALKACGGLASQKYYCDNQCIEDGIAIHRQARECGLEVDILLATNLMEMYIKCGSMYHAQAVFDNMVHRDAVSWNILILGYVENGKSSVAMELFNRMDSERTTLTFVAALKACAGVHSDSKVRLQKGKVIHRQAKESGFESDLLVATNLVEMYSSCCSMHDAQAVFDSVARRDVVLWTSLITGYVENRQSEAAMNLFTSMDCNPSSVTYIAALRAAAGLVSERECALEKVLYIHMQIKEQGFHKDVNAANTLMDVYSKCGSMVHAREVFESTLTRNVVSWNVIMLGYVENGESLTTVELFASMDCQPDTVSYVAALKASGSLAAFGLGQGVHSRICKLGLEQERVIVNCLLDFYGRCGSMSACEHVLNNMHSPDIVSWSSLIAGYSALGQTSKVFSAVKSVHEDGLVMNGITLLHALAACNHAGMVEEGKKFFEYMSKHGISPTVEHYACMVDMLGRANKLEEALEMVRSMPFEADCVVWRSLLAACKNRNGLEIGKVAFDALVACNNNNGAAYVLMGNTYKEHS